MRLSIIYNVFIRDFRKQKKRITLTLVALGWGTLSIMLLLGFGEGLHRQLVINQKGLGDGIVILWGGQTSIPFKGMGKGRPIRFREDDIAYIRKMVPDIAQVGGEYDRWGAKITYGGTVLSERINGIPPNYQQMRNHIPQMGGRMIDDMDMQYKRRVAFLGDKVKERLFKDEDAIGKQFMINSMPFTVVGVAAPKLQNSSYSGPDEDKIAIPLTTFHAMFGDPYLDDMVYQPKDLNNSKGV
ncbi:MAG TPA: ABC transporter permease, partial [candidate division Zixibacteria bacterium]|nr:ABC transporter permease [candidate division Zixibacteria bacterium]